MWQGYGAPSLEIATVELGDGVLAARGTAIRAAPEPWTVSYELQTTEEFVTTSLAVEAWGAGWSRSLVLRRGQDGAWSTEPGGPLRGLDGAPVLRNRLQGRVGAVNLVVAWVSLPDLTVHVSRQRYTHLARASGGAVVKFESGSYAADVEFDATGFVRDYPGLARRVR